MPDYPLPVHQNASIQQKEKLAQWLWTGGIIAFFAIQAVIWAVAITMTANDKSHAIVADYEKSSLSWDQSQAILKQSQSLGWQTELMVGSIGSLTGEREIRLQLLDRAGQPIEVAEINLQVFHYAQAAIVYQVRLLPQGAGVYSGKLQMQRSGYWRFSGVIDHPDGQFIFNQTTEEKW
jgi:nitrogen fixation protein FixH